MRSPNRSFACPDGLVEIGVGSGKGAAIAAPDPESIGFGVVNAVPVPSRLSVIRSKPILAAAWRLRCRT
ncbi:hypothetical protein MDUV_50960 [Mycolicibacterium duvalii]|uniref:Uncharacterized protein n=1 Tax=Mycolicibacterium duvalii TaxID=39688 RepID=A0A7I7K847_9MYCO|nr:hypothetical protein MDUV_50960 [Mycolicibacterium duvalii]